jgi:hypothetical protein
MIKQLFFTAALLLPGLAYGGNPSAVESGQIAPAGNPPVPAPAAAAGFTSQVLNADFSQVSSNWVSTNVDGCGGPTSGTRWVYRLGTYGGYGTQPPCSRLIIETPSGETQQVMHLQYFPTDNYTTPGNINAIYFLSWPADAFGPEGHLPVELYIEMTFRITPASFATTQFGGVPNIIGASIFPSPPESANNIEPDQFEVFVLSDPHNAQYGNGIPETCNNSPCGGTNNQNPPLTTDLATTYATLGFLFTSDGTQFAKCFYVNGVRQTQGGGYDPHGNFLPNSNCMKFTMVNAVDATYHNLADGIGWGGADLVAGDIYIRSVRIWSCPNWNTSNCINTLITGP